jgi:hypothetical protein
MKRVYRISRIGWLSERTTAGLCREHKKRNTLILRPNLYTSLMISIFHLNFHTIQTAYVTKQEEVSYRQNDSLI